MEALLGCASKCNILSLHTAGGDTRSLATGVGVDRGRVFANTDVETRLAAAINVNTVGGIDVDVEINALGGVVADAKGGSSVEVSENAEELLAAGSSGVMTAAGQKLNLLADVVTSLEEVEEAADNRAELSDVDRGVVDRSMKEIRCGRSGNTGKVSSTMVREHAAEVAFLRDCDTAESVAREGVASVGGAVGMKGEGAIFGGEAR